MGYDEQRSLGSVGGRLAGPVWADFMREALSGRPADDFPVPRNMTWVDICLESGLIPEQSRPVVTEVFIAGTEPSDPCPDVPWWMRFFNRRMFTPETRAENSRGSPEWFVPSEQGTRLLEELEEQLRAESRDESGVGDAKDEDDASLPTDNTSDNEGAYRGSEDRNWDESDGTPRD